VQRDSAEEPSDAALVYQAREGDRGAFAALYIRHQAMVYRFAYSMTGSVTLAEDVVQEVFLRLMRNLGRYSPDQAALSTYLYGIARNVSRARARKESRFVDFDSTRSFTSDGDPAAALVEGERLRALRAAIRELPIKFREVLVLCDLHEVDYAQTALILGIPVGTVRSRLFRARQRVQRHIQRVERPVSSLRVATSKVFS
jgi:RNA polymerase sigma-70 factor (ECF subfamily)